jgi:hypothetical protein
MSQVQGRSVRLDPVWGVSRMRSASRIARPPAKMTAQQGRSDAKWWKQCADLERAASRSSVLCARCAGICVEIRLRLREPNRKQPSLCRCKGNELSGRRNRLTNQIKSKRGGVWDKAKREVKLCERRNGMGEKIEREAKWIEGRAPADNVERP